jgi:uncharacterized protein (UPF0332 family)
MSVDGSDFLNLAIRLSGGGSEAEWRSAASRAYYGAFHLARDVVVSCGVALPKTADAHDKLQWCLSHAGDESLAAIASKLNSLRSSRNVADYDLLSLQFSKRDSVLVILRRTQQVVDGLAQFRSQPDFAEKRFAIRQYAKDTLRLSVTDEDET